MGPQETMHSCFDKDDTISSLSFQAVVLKCILLTGYVSSDIKSTVYMQNSFDENNKECLIVVKKIYKHTNTFISQSNSTNKKN